MILFSSDRKLPAKYRPEAVSSLSSQAGIMLLTPKFQQMDICVDHLVTQFSAKLCSRWPICKQVKCSSIPSPGGKRPLSLDEATCDILHPPSGIGSTCVPTGLSSITGSHVASYNHCDSIWGFCIYVGAAAEHILSYAVHNAHL